MGVVGRDISLCKSSLPNANRGVYALRSFKAGEYITGYDGHVVESEESRKYDFTYAVEMSNGNTLIGFHEYPDDDWNGKNAGQLINDNICPFFTGQVSNVDFYEKKGKMYIRALREIKAGEELFLSCGYGYWKGKKQYTHVAPSFDYVVYKTHLDRHLQMEANFRYGGVVLECSHQSDYNHVLFDCLNTHVCHFSKDCYSQIYQIWFGDLDNIRIRCESCYQETDSKLERDSDMDEFLSKSTCIHNLDSEIGDDREQKRNRGRNNGVLL